MFCNGARIYLMILLLAWDTSLSLTATAEDCARHNVKNQPRGEKHRGLRRINQSAMRKGVKVAAQVGRTTVSKKDVHDNLSDQFGREWQTLQTSLNWEEIPDVKKSCPTVSLKSEQVKTPPSESTSLKTENSAVVTRPRPSPCKSKNLAVKPRRRYSKAKAKRLKSDADGRNRRWSFKFKSSTPEAPQAPAANLPTPAPKLDPDKILQDADRQMQAVYSCCSRNADMFHQWPKPLGKPLIEQTLDPCRSTGYQCTVTDPRRVFSKRPADFTRLHSKGNSLQTLLPGLRDEDIEQYEAVFKNVPGRASNFDNMLKMKNKPNCFGSQCRFSPPTACPRHTCTTTSMPKPCCNRNDMSDPGYDNPQVPDTTPTPSCKHVDAPSPAQSDNNNQATMEWTIALNQEPNQPPTLALVQPKSASGNKQDQVIESAQKRGPCKPTPYHKEWAIALKQNPNQDWNIALKQNTDTDGATESQARGSNNDVRDNSTNLSPTSATEQPSRGTPPAMTGKEVRQQWIVELCQEPNKPPGLQVKPLPRESEDHSGKATQPPPSLSSPADHQHAPGNSSPPGGGTNPPPVAIKAGNKEPIKYMYVLRKVPCTEPGQEDHGPAERKARTGKLGPVRDRRKGKLVPVKRKDVARHGSRLKKVWQKIV